MEMSTNEASPTPQPTKTKTRARRKMGGQGTGLLLLVGVFLLGSINRERLLQSVKEQIVASQQATAPAAGPAVARAEEDTAVIISSSWIPSHPSTTMIERVLNSTQRLKGLSPTAPVFITIDHFRYSEFAGAPQDLKLKDRLGVLEAYTVNLHNLFLTNPRVHVLPAVKNLHIGGSVMKALELIGLHYPTVRYVHYMQHDFFFHNDVDHAALVHAMDTLPEKINWVRFPKRDPTTIGRTCGNERTIQYSATHAAIEGTFNGTLPGLIGYLYPTNEYSDNNHLARYDWYRQTIASLIKLDRAPEDPLQRRAFQGCSGLPDPIHGLYLYDSEVIGHLDGRHSKGR